MRTTESGFSELVYLAASQEHLTVAGRLPDDGRYVLASYIAGVAVEALFSAFESRQMSREVATNAVQVTQHDAGHNLFRLAENGHFWDGMPRTQKQAIAGELSGLCLRWRNNHRYRSEKSFRDWLTANRLYIVNKQRSTTEDVVSFNAEIVVEAARRIVEIGVARW